MTQPLLAIPPDVARLRVVRLALGNPLPHRQEDWEINQGSRFLGKARGTRRLRQ